MFLYTIAAWVANFKMEGKKMRAPEMQTSVVIPICGTSNSWKVAEPSDPTSLTQDRFVSLEIHGDDKNGYHLVMSPDGCFTADTWHATVDDALESANRVFGVPLTAWSQSTRRS